jgi:uncharacterized membrane protein (UPF0136 family)
MEGESGDTRLRFSRRFNGQAAASFGIMTANSVLWIYIVLLVIGGVMGWMKARSRVSLIMSVGFAAVLSLYALGLLAVPYLAEILLAVLLAVFALRLRKTKKFMPAGLMCVLTVATLALRYLLR